MFKTGRRARYSDDFETQPPNPRFYALGVPLFYRRIPKNQILAKMVNPIWRNGAPEGSRTPNLQIRSLALYPIELRARTWRRERDSNPRYPFEVHTLSRRAPSTARPPLQ